MADNDLPDLSIFLNDFLNDSREDLQKANQALLALEKDPSEAERLNEIFRSVHTLKSSSALLEFAGIAVLAHFTEDLLDRLRKQELPLNHNAIDILLESIDAIESFIQRRVAGEEEKVQSAAALAFVEELKRKVGSLESQELLVRQGVIVIDETGLVEAFNPAAVRMFGYPVGEVVGRKLSLLMPEPYKSEQESYVANYLLTGKAKVIGIGREVVGLRKDGSTFPIELAINDVSLGARRFFVGIVREIARRQGRVAAVLTAERSETIRVRVALLDSLFNLVGELVITKNRIDTLVSESVRKDLKSALGTMDRLVNELQEDVSAARLVAVDEIFQKFPRMVRDLAVEQHKQIDLVLEGRHIELDKAVLDAISEPLVHLLRNAVDHGIELPDARRLAHKSKRGTLRLAAKRAENHTIIEVEDDGAGIDVDHIREVAVRKGIVSPEDALSLPDNEALNLIFAPGFSTADQVTELSGRGVGLDVVKTATERLGGTVTVTTRLGAGTRFTMQLPVATAIIQTLMVGVEEHIFAIPSDIVLETLDVKPGDVRGVGKHLVLTIRGEVIPFVSLADLLHIPVKKNHRDQIAVVVHRSDKLVGLGVDMLLDQVENIIKPFDPVAQKLKGFSGGTILGDGRVALLLDIPSLL
jgi:two-component system chemotaxis sensor kinase CheA